MKEKESIQIVAKKVICNVCKIKAKERVLIITNRTSNVLSDVEIISQSLYDAALEVGALPTIIIQPVKTLLDYAEESVMAAIKSKPAVIFSISQNKLGKDKQGMIDPYTGKDGQKYNSYFDLLLTGNQEVRAVWTPGITLDMFSRTVDIDYFVLERRCSRMISQYEDVETVHVTSPAGTDIIVPVKGRHAMSDDGRFSENGMGGNIPAGEVFISPVVGDGKKTGCQGKIVFDGSMTTTNGDILINNPISVTVVNGFVTDITGGEEAALLLKSITDAEKQAVWMEKEGKLAEGKGESYAKNARNIGELGIGLNPSAKITGNMLEDEKAFHTCHFAIGSNYDGDGESLIHLDGLVKNPTIVLNYSAGNSFVLVKDGILME